jgi:hypothetical protein
MANNLYIDKDFLGHWRILRKIMGAEHWAIIILDRFRFRTTTWKTTWKWRQNGVAYPYMGTTRHFHVVFHVRVLDLNLSITGGSARNKMCAQIHGGSSHHMTPLPWQLVPLAPLQYSHTPGFSKNSFAFCSFCSEFSLFSFTFFRLLIICSKIWKSCMLF